MHDLITVIVLLALLGGSFAVGAAYLRRAAIAEDDLEESQDELKHVAEMMEKAEDAHQNRPRTRRDALNRL